MYRIYGQRVDGELARRSHVCVRYNNSFRHPAQSRRQWLLPKPPISATRIYNRISPFFTMSGSVSKIAAERNQRALMELAMRPGNGKWSLLPHLSSSSIGGFYFAPPAWPATISSGDTGSWQASVCPHIPHKPRIADCLSPSSLFALADLCADCKTRNPRWASHNLGIFIWYVVLPPYSRAILILCSVNCASVHRKIGTHISKVYVYSTGDAYAHTDTESPGKA